VTGAGRAASAERTLRVAGLATLDRPFRLRADLGTVWLAQLDMAALFQTSEQNVVKHLKGIYAEQELSQDSLVNQ
jgi:hypothetical protein